MGFEWMQRPVIFFYLVWKETRNTLHTVDFSLIYKNKSKSHPLPGTDDFG